MRQSTIAVNGPLTVVVDDMDGDLQVAGWERAEVSAKTDGDEFDLRLENGTAHVSCENDLILYLPRDARLEAGDVGGDADIRGVSGGIQGGDIGGDLQMRAVGPTKLKAVGGDLNVRACSGDFSAEEVGSGASLRDIQGALRLAGVGSDLYLRNMGGDIQAQTDADAVLFLQPRPGTKISVKAEADILLRLPASADAELVLQGGSMESISVDFPGVEPGEEGMTRRVVLGSGGAKINLTAEGDLIVTSRADEWQSLLADFDNGSPDEPFPDGFPGVPADFHKHASKRVQEAAQHTIRATLQAQRHTDRAQRRVEVALHRAEEKAHAAERRSRFYGVVIHNGSGKPFSSASRTQSTPPGEPVSDEERLTVLKMLQNKKISIEEAEKLLAALDGK